MRMRMMKMRKRIRMRKIDDNEGGERWMLRARTLGFSR